MDAQIVERATLSPAECMLTHTGDGPMLDLQREFEFSHVGRMYLSVQMCREIGQMVGLVEPFEAVPDDRDERLAELEAEVQQLRRFKESAKYTIEQIGQTVKNKPGRPRKEITSAAS